MISFKSFSDGFSPLPLLVRDTNNQSLLRYFGDPSISLLSNLIIKNIRGNSPIKNASVILISDLHCDKIQKFVRSIIINDIIKSSENTYKKVIFLVEGAQLGEIPSEWVYEQLIGNQLVYPPHVIFGWDSLQLNQIGISLIKKMKIEMISYKNTEMEYASLNKKKSELIRDINISVDELFDKVELIEAKLSFLRNKMQQLSFIVNTIFAQTQEIVKQRNIFLYRSINQVLKLHPKSLVFVIGGGKHFEYISSRFKGINHSILDIIETRRNIDLIEALDEVYGN